MDILVSLASFAGLVLTLLVWVFAAYFVIRLAVTAALKSHTRWIDNGKPQRRSTPSRTRD